MNPKLKNLLIVDGMAVILTLLVMVNALPAVTTNLYGGQAIGILGVTLPAWIGVAAGIVAFMLWRVFLLYLRHLPPDEAKADLDNLNQVFGKVGELIDVATRFHAINQSQASDAAQKFVALLPQETSAALANQEQPVEPSQDAPLALPESAPQEAPSA